MGKLDKRPYVHRALEMKQPCTMIEPFEKPPSPLRIMSMFPHPLKAFLKRRADEHAGGGGRRGGGSRAGDAGSARRRPS